MVNIITVYIPTISSDLTLLKGMPKRCKSHFWQWLYIKRYQFKFSSWNQSQRDVFTNSDQVHRHNFLEFQDELDESTAGRHLKLPRSLSGRSLHLTLVTKWSRSHMTLKIQISMSWPRSNQLSHLRPRVQIDMFAFCFMAIGPLLVEI